MGRPAGYTLSPEARAIIAENSRGRRHRDTSIEKMRQAKLGKACSPETRAKISAAKRNIPTIDITALVVALRATIDARPRCWCSECGDTVEVSTDTAALRAALDAYDRAIGIKP